ncbi:MAG: hypothetical protein JWO05_1342 [Gemmatimonadetes bacterium]|nr:hypothetical protein [Gemmatimonadota bacterium]
MKLARLIPFVLLVSAVRAPAQTAAQWREDLQAIARELPRQHAGAFRLASEDSFRAVIARVDARMAGANRDEAIVGLMQAVAAIHDGHTAMNPVFMPMFGWHRFPVMIQSLSDGLFIQSADPSLARLAGMRIVRIGTARADSALAAAITVTAAENPMYAEHWGVEMLMIPEVLHGLGLTSSATSASFVLERGGKRETVQLEGTLSSVAMSHTSGPVAFDSAWVDAATVNGATLPVSRHAPASLHYLEWIPAQRAVYARYGSVRDAPGETVAQFANRMLQMVDSLGADRLVLDVRGNGGGNDFLNRPLEKGILKSRVNQKGRLFVLIGRKTFSAAQLLVNDLERFSDATFIGEPTANRVNFYGDAQPLTLPNSGLPVMISRVWWQADQRDARMWLAPSVYAPVTSADYLAGRDRALEAALEWGASRQPRARLVALAPRAATSQVIADSARAMLADVANRFGNIEADVNAAGYEMLRQHDVKSAVRAFEANSALFPESANAFDSLGDGLRADGDVAGAIRSYERALQLNPRQDSSRNALAELRKGG